MNDGADEYAEPPEAAEAGSGQTALLRLTRALTPLLRSMPATMTRIMMVVRALTSGVMPDLFMERMSTGRVEFLAPASILLMTTSSTERVNERKAADITPGMMLGRVTRKKVWIRLAPRSMEASSSVSPSPLMRPLMVTTA